MNYKSYLIDISQRSNDYKLRSIDISKRLIRLKLLSIELSKPSNGGSKELTQIIINTDEQIYRENL